MIEIEINMPKILNYVEKAHKDVEDKVDEICKEIVQEIFKNVPSSWTLLQTVPEGTVYLRFERSCRRVGYELVFYDKNMKEIKQRRNVE
jgi:hypothetical protein